MKYQNVVKEVQKITTTMAISVMFMIVITNHLNQISNRGNATTRVKKKNKNKTKLSTAIIGDGCDDCDGSIEAMGHSNEKNNLKNANNHLNNCENSNNNA